MLNEFNFFYFLKKLGHEQNIDSFNFDIQLLPIQKTPQFPVRDKTIFQWFFI